jgi:hypothetical protein
MNIPKVRNRILNKHYAIGFHVMDRVVEQDLYEVAEIIAYLAEFGGCEAGFNQQGLCWTFDGDIESTPYRMVVGPHRYDATKLYIISLYRLKPGIKKGKNYRKFNGRDVTYTFEFTKAS